MEIDMVAHCGESTEGFYLNTLCDVDVASGWAECLPVWGKVITKPEIQQVYLATKWKYQ